MADIKDRNSPPLWGKFSRTSRLRLSSDPTTPSASRSYPSAGSSSGPLLGSIAAEGSPRIGRTSIARHLHSCPSHHFVSCSENYAIRAKLSGQTLKRRFSSVAVPIRSWCGVRRRRSPRCAPRPVSDTASSIQSRRSLRRLLFGQLRTGCDARGGCYPRDLSIGPFFLNESRNRKILI